MSLLARYGRPSAAIEAQSLAHVEACLAPHLPAEPGARAVAVRLVYAAGDLSLIDAVRIHPRAVEQAVEVLTAGRAVVLDVAMVAAGVAGGPLARLGCPLHIAVAAPEAAEQARERGTTRAAAGMAALAPRWAGGVVAVGNAPTALLALLDLLDAGAPQPAVVIGTPVGFVAAAESKDELTRRAIPYVTVLGTRGGSALAAAALNALGRLALDPPRLPSAPGAALQ